jgi:hypothetical protein
MATRYQKGIHFSDREFRLILKLFSEDICDQNSIFEKGEIELDESYFGAKRGLQSPFSKV